MNRNPQNGLKSLSIEKPVLSVNVQDKHILDAIKYSYIHQNDWRFYDREYNVSKKLEKHSVDSPISIDDRIRRSVNFWGIFC